MENIEVELKFPLLNKKELEAKLNSLAKKEKEVREQKDTYFTPKHKNYLDTRPTTEWLRIRETQKGASIAYKNYHKEKDAKAVSCDEFETKIGNPEILHKIFMALEIKELTVVHKTRKAWEYKDTEIAIDEVKGLGDYIEIEAKGKFNSINEAKKHLYAVLEELGAKTGEQDFEGYPFLILKKNGLL